MRKILYSLLCFLLGLKITTYASPLEDAYYQDENYYSEQNFNSKKILKQLFKEYINSYKEVVKIEEKLSPEAQKIIQKNKKFLEKGKIKALSKVHDGIRGKVLYIYKDYANEIQNMNVKNSDKLYILTTFIDKKILKDRKLKITKYMENVSIRQTGVSTKKKEIT
ncbi:MAG: hypothetical protein DSY59_01595 [Persephonella sp.]|nr:MAG: hypothetical protein DSY60_05420 [Persephonella sp.]RUM61455.1 MAG: hypothetical protein DSY59_01595 [Persephonella sp.]